MVGRFEGDHIGGVDEFASLIAVENEDIFVGAELILGLEFLGAAEAPIGVDVFGGEFLFGGELILTHEGLEIGDDLAGVGKEDDRSNGFFEVSEEIFGLGTEGEFLIPRIVPSFEVTEAKVIEHQDDAGDEGDLEEDIETDLEAMNFHGLSRGIWKWRSHGRWGRGCLGLPLSVLKDLEVKEEDEGGHGGIPDDRAGIDDPFGEVLHVLDGGDVGEEIFDGGRGDI